MRVLGVRRTGWAHINTSEVSDRRRRESEEKCSRHGSQCSVLLASEFMALNALFIHFLGAFLLWQHVHKMTDLRAGPFLYLILSSCLLM
ncbi:unnamed protein product [Linum tenue]|uniref:Uncharacterized protein n=1 Tax=Linum tenue TaxID=586396 RepID=A0AAV0LCF0_9ROSI|nr:unnamed protein product [Linum tenue]